LLICRLRGSRIGLGPIALPGKFILAALLIAADYHHCYEHSGGDCRYHNRGDCRA
jgi:hypothetical protein